MPDFESTIKSYRILSQSYYANTEMTAEQREKKLEEILISWDDENGNAVAGEIKIEWHSMDDGNPPVPELSLFDDAWCVLPLCTDFLVGLAKLNGTAPEPCVITALLDECGFRDATPRMSPYYESVKEAVKASHAPAPDA